MRKVLLCAGALALIGCGQTTSYVKSDTTLGRVVVYRNGVAYFERYAEVEGDSLKLHVPGDKVDDFLKSLTVVDAATGEPAPISYPSLAGAGSTIDMKVGVSRSGRALHKLRLSYVTEAPSWKPSYRVVVNKAGKVDLQGWAIVDNTSGEDWKDVKLGVGASSAMSFRYDLKGLRIVQRETLQENDLFAQAPPMGGATYGGPSKAANQRIVGDITDDALALADQKQADTAKKDETGSRHYARAETKPSAGTKPMDKRVEAPASAPGVVSGGVGGSLGGAIAQADPVARLANTLRGTSNTIVVEGYATSADKDKMQSSLDRANKLREQLVRNGVDPNKVVALGKGEQQGRAGGARIVEEAPAPPKTPPADANANANVDLDGSPDKPRVAAAGSTEPIGTSHFESGAAMTVPKGTSAMVSILRSETEGEVVYLYDPESPRGNTQFPFRTVRFRNPTDSALESGPVSVFGEGRFVGEGLAEPIPAKSVAFVPFALDR